MKAPVNYQIFVNGREIPLNDQERTDRAKAEVRAAELATRKKAVTLSWQLGDTPPHTIASWVDNERVGE